MTVTLKDVLLIYPQNRGMNLHISMSSSVPSSFSVHYRVKILILAKFHFSILIVYKALAFSNEFPIIMINQNLIRL